MDGLSPTGTHILLGTGGTHSMVGFSQECAPVRCRDFAPKVDLDWINRLSDLMNRLSLLCADGGNEVSSCDVSLGLFNRALSDMGILGIACVHLDVSGGTGLVRAGSCLLVSVDTGEGVRFPLTMTAHSLTGGSKGCGWQQFMTWGRGLLLLQSARERAPSAKEAGWHVSGLCTLGRDQLQLRR